MALVNKPTPSDSASLFTAISRAVGAGPAGPAAAGPIFGQLTCAKMPPPMSFGGLFNCYSKYSYARRNLGLQLSSTRFLLRLEKNTLCRLKKVSVEA